MLPKTVALSLRSLNIPLRIKPVGRREVAEMTRVGAMCDPDRDDHFVPLEKQAQRVVSDEYEVDGAVIGDVNLVRQKIVCL